MLAIIYLFATFITDLFGTMRRDCLDHVLIFGERHLRRVLKSYLVYHNETRTHLGLGKDAPLGPSCPTRSHDCHRTGLVRSVPPLRADIVFGKDRRPLSRPDPVTG